MPDYSCYFRIKNSTHVPLELLWKNKPVQGHWLDDTIPGVIYPDTEVTITLKDDTWCTFSLLFKFQDDADNRI